MPAGPQLRRGPAETGETQEGAGTRTPGGPAPREKAPQFTQNAALAGRGRQ